MVLGDSCFGKLANKFVSPILAEVLILLACGLLWHEGFLGRVGLSVFCSSFLPPILLLFALLFVDKSKINFSKAQGYLAVFLLVGLVSGVFAAGRGISAILILSGWALFAQFFLALIVAQGLPNPRRLITGLVILSIPNVVAGFYQFIFGQATSALWVTPAESDITVRAFGFFGSPNVLGSVVAIIALISLGLALSSCTKREKLLYSILSISAVIAMIFTYSRSAWLGFILGFLTIILIRSWRAIFVSPILLLALLSDKIQTRIMTIFTTTYWFDSSLDGRLWAINNGLSLLGKYPLLGTGPGTYGGELALRAASPVYLEGIQGGYVSLYFTDNEWLQIAVQTGIVGVTFFVLFVTNVFKALFLKYKKTGNMLILSTLAAFVAFVTAGLFENIIEFGAVAVPMAVFLGASLQDQGKE